MSAPFLAIEIGGTKLQLVVGDGQGHPTAARRLQVDRGAGGRGIREQIQRAVPELTPAEGFAAAAVGFGGPVDRNTGRICCSHQIEGWADFELRAWLEELLRVPVLVENDANIAALGEATVGAGAGSNPVFYVTLGSGVGGGLVVDGRIYHGATPGEAEIGHLRLDRTGATVESRCSGWAVDARIRQLKDAGVRSVLCDWMSGPPGGEARFLARALELNDAAARRILEDTATDLAFALSHVTHLFHPEVIVLGGGLSLVGEPLRRSVADALPRFLMEVLRPGPRLALAKLGEEAVPRGCLVAAGRMCRRSGGGAA